MRWHFSVAAAVWIALWLCYDKNGDAMCSICAAVFHECGHLLTLCIFGDSPKLLRFGVFGMRIERQQTTRLSYRQELIASASGPAANGILSVGLLAIHLYRPALVSLLLGSFNLLPVRPLDGGEMLYAFLCRRMLPENAAAICKKTAACVLVPLAAVCIWGFTHGRRDYSFVLLSLYVLSVVLPASGI